MEKQKTEMLIRLLGSSAAAFEALACERDLDGNQPQRNCAGKNPPWVCLYWRTPQMVGVPCGLLQNHKDRCLKKTPTYKRRVRLCWGKGGGMGACLSW